MSELLPVGNTLAHSSEFTIAADAKASLVLKAGVTGPVPLNAQMVISRKDAAGNFTEMYRMSRRSQIGITIVNDGADTLTLRATRYAGALVGLDRL